VEFIPRLIAALVIFAVSLILAAIVQRGIRRTLSARQVDEELSHVLARISRWVVIVLGVIAALDQVNFAVTSFLAGLGVLGVTVGFAFQDIAKNFMASLLLLIQQPFEIGDLIRVVNYEGKVLDVTMRDTILRTLDGLRVSIPNADVYTNPITNLSALKTRRRDFLLRLDFKDNPEQAAHVLLEAVADVEGVESEPAPFIETRGLPDGQIEMQVFFYVDQSTYDLGATHSRVVHAVRLAAQQAGVDVPYPTQKAITVGGAA